MSKTESIMIEVDEDTMLPEYEIDYTNLRPNPFIKRMPGSKVIVIEPDVASIFSTQEEVNTALRFLMKLTQENPLTAKQSPAS